jgi:hypothetical protein
MQINCERDERELVDVSQIGNLTEKHVPEALFAR